MTQDHKYRSLYEYSILTHTTVHFENQQIKTAYKLYYLFASDSRRRSDSEAF